MELNDLMKEWRIWVLVITLLASTALLFPFDPLPYKNTDSGDVALENNVNKGLDLKGGTQVLLSVESNNTTKEQVDQIKSILQRRVSAFGLTQTSVRTVRLGDSYRIQMEIASTNQSRLSELVSQEGRFEARLPLTVQESVEFQVEDSHEINYDNGTVEVNGSSYSPGDTFELDGALFYYMNNTDSGANLEVVAYDGEDVQDVLTSDGRVSPQGQGYGFRFPVVISSEAAENVRQVTSNYPSGVEYIQRIGGTGNADLMLYVDGNMQSSLAMSNVFKTQTVTQPSINGGAPTASEARSEMKELQAILQSGSLPAPVKIESLSQITSSLGGDFMSAAIISIIASLLAVGVLVFARYRNIKLVVPIVITGASEVYILLGMFFSTIITLDLASIAGIIAAVGTGVDDQIIITDESGREKMRDWKERLKRAFFVIFTSAASTIGAMMPIVSPSLSNIAIGAAGVGLIGYDIVTRETKPHHLGIGALAIAVSAITFQFSPSGFALQSVKGFAITTILGVMIGITITRPAYAKMLEFIEN